MPGDPALLPDRITPIYRDDWVAAVHKPPGLLVHRTGIAAEASDFALQQARDLYQCHVYPVHRLDRATSGILLLALDPETAGLLGKAFQCHVVEKRYLAVVRGWPPAEGSVDRPLRKVRMSRKKVTPAEPQPARTRYRCCDTAELPVTISGYPTTRLALVEALPETGRTHQIRRHLKRIDHPIVGDTQYGDSRYNRYFRETYGCNRLLLAATTLRLVHPRTRKTLTLTCPPDPTFRKVLNALGLDKSNAHADRSPSSSFSPSSSPPAP